MNLHERSDEDLLSDVTNLVGSHRALTATLVVHLAEIEERRLHLFMGFSSMFDFCTKRLGFSEGEAFRRIVAARLSRRFPVVISLLASGGLSLSTLVLLRESLTEANHEDLFAVVTGKSKRAVQELLAGRFPRPDAPSRIREQAIIEPLSEGRYRVEFMAGEELRRKIELCRDLMSHSNPRGDLAVVIERGIDLLLAKLESERLATAKRPRSAPDPNKAGLSRISSAVRRKVFERDGLQCTFVAEGGRRCEARTFLELDHIEPKALGGRDEAQNLRVRCKAHNQLWAEQVFGRNVVESARRLRQNKSTAARRAAGPTPHGSREASDRTTVREGNHVAPLGVFEKVRLALRRLGFRDDQARGAVAKVIRMHEAQESLALEQALREALRFVTAA